MISIPIVELNRYLEEQIKNTQCNIDNEVEEDTLTAEKAIRLSTKMRVFNIVKLYINKEE
jgi:hypothetical protein